MKRREIFFIPAAMAAGPALAKPGWTPLFDGKTLNGWAPIGHARWEARDGAIIGRQGAGGEAGELMTTGQWKNFDLELEWRMKWPGNSGIWFRYSNAKSAYQADIIDEASYPGVLSGSLYCAGKMFIAENRDPASVKKDGWNRMRILAHGDEITVEQNGKRVIHLRDATFPGPGSVGIQVHPGKKYDGMEAHVRRIRIRPLD